MFFNSFFRDAGFDDYFNYGFENTRQNGTDTTLYEILGLNKDATDGQIRKAYLQLAKQHHPDKGGDQKIFQNITNAYEILSNKEKRELYDKYGLDGLQGESNSRTEMRHTKHIKRKVFCSLEDLYKGKTFNLTITPKVVCKTCKGEGGTNGYRVPCRHCGGSGTTFVTMNDFFLGSRRMEVDCNYCGGAGAYFNDNYQCPTCHGQRIIQEQRNVEIYLEPGMGNGSVIRLSEAADEAPGMIAGDILLLVHEKPHSLFTRKGPDLQITLHISLGEALCGFVKSIRQLDGRILYITCGAGEVKPGSVKRLEGEGMPIEGNRCRRGSLFIHFVIDYPNNLHEEQIQALRAIFNVPIPALPGEVDVQKVYDASPEMFGNSIPDYSHTKEAYNSSSDEDETNRHTDCPIQ